MLGAHYLHTKGKDMSRTATEQAIASDLGLCDLGLAFAKGSARRAFRDHRKVCIAQIKAWNREDGLDQLSDDDLLAELAA